VDNPWFTIPMLAWAVAGGTMLIVFSKQDLFRAVNTRYSDFTDILFYYLTYMGQADVIIPVLLLLMLLRPFRNWWYLALASACNLIPFAIDQLLKSIFDQPRPRLLYYDRLWMHYLPHWPVYLSRSFPSGHSAGAFSFFCFLSLILPAGSRWLGIVFFVLAMVVCYSRMYLAAHFFADVYAGSVLGGGLTILVYHLMETYKSKFYKQTASIDAKLP
jgi:membrane-associated phospholipid phosphatase